MWLIFKLFGNGRGLASPYCCDVFYWLVDTHLKERNKNNGKFYKWLGGFGAQLESFEFYCPHAGTTRRLFGHDFVVFITSRKWIMVRCSWALKKGVKDAAELRELKVRLDKWGHGL